MAYTSRKHMSWQKHALSEGKDGLVPFQCTINTKLYALFEDISRRSGKTVSEIASIYLTVAVDKDAKIDPSVDRAMEQIVAKDIAHRFGPLLRLLNPEQTKNKVSN